MGGFWGSGASVTLRDLQLKGIAGGFLKYRFGDIDIKMTPYTLYNYNGELSQNEAEIFRFNRELRESENFNFGNYWGQQGLDAACKVGFDKVIESADIYGFIVRNRSVANNPVPDRLQGGGNVQFNINKTSFFGLNYINLFDVPTTVNDSINTQYQNYVTTANFKFDLKALYLFGEGGMSGEKFLDSTKKYNTINGNFFEVGLGKAFCKEQWKADLSFRRVTDDFYSPGAQSKRINYGATPAVFPTVSNNSYDRSTGLFDLVNDYSIYNPKITSTFQKTYLPFNPVTPYGQATPNRMGLDLNILYKDSADRYRCNLSAQELQEVRGEGTTELRNFSLINVYGEINLDKIYGLKKTLSINAGVQYGRNYRNGQGLVDDVNLTSTAIDAGAVIEIVPRFDFLLGTKILFANGTDYLSVYDNFNRITSFTKVNYDGTTEYVSSAAFRYRFNDNVTFSLQGSNYDKTFANDSKSNFSFNSIYLLFNMKF